MIFDSHTHLNLAAFNQDLEQIIQKNNREGVFVINVGTCLETSEKAITIANQYKNNWATIGLHPSHTMPMKLDKKEITITDSKLDFLAPETFNKNFELLLQEPKVVAIGECGLDYTYLKDFSIEEQKLYKKMQKNEFRKQIQIAQKYQLPLNLHIRHLYEQALSILEEEKFTAKAVFHFFTGSQNQAKAILNKNFLLGFSGVITYSSEMDLVIKETPLEKILIETDAPYVAPVPFRGQRNEPIYVKEIAKKIAQIKKLPLKEVIRVTFDNTLKFFDIKIDN